VARSSARRSRRQQILIVTRCGQLLEQLERLCHLLLGDATDGEAHVVQHVVAGRHRLVHHVKAHLPPDAKEVDRGFQAVDADHLARDAQAHAEVIAGRTRSRATTLQSRGEPAGPSGRTAHPTRPACFARTLAGGAPSREGLARPSEASGEVVVGGGRRAERTLPGFPCATDGNRRAEFTLASLARRSLPRSGSAVTQPRASGARSDSSAPAQRLIEWASLIAAGRPFSCASAFTRAWSTGFSPRRAPRY